MHAACGLAGLCQVAFAPQQPPCSIREVRTRLFYPVFRHNKRPAKHCTVGLLAIEISNLRSTKNFLSPNVIRYHHPPRRKSAPLSLPQQLCILRGKRDHHNSGTARVMAYQVPLPSLDYFAPQDTIAPVTHPGTLRQSFVPPLVCPDAMHQTLSYGTRDQWDLQLLCLSYTSYDPARYRPGE